MSLVVKKDYQFDAHLKIPIDQASSANRDIWIDTASGKLNFRIGGLIVEVPLAEEVSSGLAVSDTATVDLTLAAGTLSAAVLDSPKLEGNTLAQVQTAIIAAISDGASAAYDTLLEIQGFLEDHDDVDAALTAGLALRPRFYAGTVPNGSSTANIDHNLGLTNIHDFTARIFVSATGAEEEYAMVGSTNNRVILTDETGSNIATGRRIFLTAGV